MELRHLRYFIAVAETGSLTIAAARRLHTSQPSLSRQIKDLEDQVGAELLVRSPRGITLTEAGKVFFDHAKMALSQVNAGIEAARRAAQPGKQRFAMGFLTGQEMTWLPEAMHILRAELPNIDVTVSSDHSPDLADALVRGKLDLAFLRAEPGYDLIYRPIMQEPLVVLMPSDHRLASRDKVRARDLLGEPFIGMGNKANVLRVVIDDYLHSANVDITPSQVVDNPATLMSLVASTRGITLIPAYVQNLMPWSVTSRPLAGKAPSIDLAVGYSRTNSSPILKMFLSHVDELISRVSSPKPR
ncbi:MAG TPA: LysR family transcriptional regulator [Dyella sp.]|uniref:LysR family transcriptional regulator n=1 Tax=Dyella sp. TaxID=1869338 RepID=UPI002CF38167|nr:LysR family transcriptional regulator [Dyella sp.]HUB90600.1 LysR family transcriptional regulator [Dyella sp.]